MQTFARVAHPFPGCLRKHLMKNTIISVICTNMRKVLLSAVCDTSCRKKTRGKRKVNEIFFVLLHPE